MELTYERVLQLLIIAYSKCDIYGNRISIREQRLYLKFSEYVRSQLHLPVISGFYASEERSIYQYANAMDYLEGDHSKLNDALLVAKYYYEDMSNFLIKNRNRIILTTDISELKVPNVQVNFKKERNSLLDIIKKSYIDGKKIGSQNAVLVDELRVKYPDTISRLKLDDEVDIAKELPEMIQEFRYSDLIDYCNGGKDTYKQFILNTDNFLHASILKCFLKEWKDDISNIKNIILEDYYES